MDDELVSLSDASLVVAIGRWRHDALAEAYRRHGGSVFGLARRVLGDRVLAEEVVQEVFLRLWDQPDRYDPTRGACGRTCCRRVTAEPWTSFVPRTTADQVRQAPVAVVVAIDALHEVEYRVAWVHHPMTAALPLW